MTSGENGSKSVCGAVFVRVNECPYEVALSRATPSAPSTPTFIRLARNRSLRASVMRTDPLVKTYRRERRSASVLGEMVCAVVDFATLEVVVEPRTVDHRELTAELAQERRQPGVDDLVRTGRVLLEAAQHLVVDDAVRDLAQAGVRQIRLPVGEVVAVAEVDVQEMPAGTQHPLDLAEKAVEVRVDVRGFDVDHGVEGLVGERQ